jgi:hypothetical protein
MYFSVHFTNQLTYFWFFNSDQIYITVRYAIFIHVTQHSLFESQNIGG